LSEKELERNGLNKVVRVKSWEDFKQLIIKFNVDSIVFNVEQGVPARHVTGLRLMLLVEGTQYIFIDTATGEIAQTKRRLRKTGIPLTMDKYRNLFIKEEDIINFVRNELERKDFKLISYWTS